MISIQFNKGVQEFYRIVQNQEYKRHELETGSNCINPHLDIQYFKGNVNRGVLSMNYFSVESYYKLDELQNSLNGDKKKLDTNINSSAFDICDFEDMECSLDDTNTCVDAYREGDSAPCTMLKMELEIHYHAIYQIPAVYVRLYVSRGVAASNIGSQTSHVSSAISKEYVRETAWVLLSYSETDEIYQKHNKFYYKDGATGLETTYRHGPTIKNRFIQEDHPMYNTPYCCLHICGITECLQMMCCNALTLREPTNDIMSNETAALRGGIGNGGVGILNMFPTLTIAQFLAIVGPYVVLDLPAYSSRCVHPTSAFTGILSPETLEELVSNCIEIDKAMQCKV